MGLRQKPESCWQHKVEKMKTLTENRFHIQGNPV